MKLSPGVDFIKLERTAYSVMRKSVEVQLLRQSANFFYLEFHQQISELRTCANRQRAMLAPQIKHI